MHIHLTNYFLFQEFFKDLEPTKGEFVRIRQQGICEGQILPTKQMQDMEMRFKKLTHSAAHSHAKLEYDELRFRLLALIVAVETKLKSWTVKYGQQQSVEDLLTEYMVSGIAYISSCEWLAMFWSS